MPRSNAPAAGRGLPRPAYGDLESQMWDAKNAVEIADLATERLLPSIAKMYPQFADGIRIANYALRNATNQMNALAEEILAGIHAEFDDQKAGAA
ncbi:hypothetical protein ACI2JN_12565 [Ochrobactrum teleogrylli]|uniref:hypothetical protein n=1 Tax=Ochrobactrum teleogrylli TaxID=2479765 RepID=UPI00384BFFE1